jgi:hypothetical protein
MDPTRVRVWNSQVRVGLGVSAGVPMSNPTRVQFIFGSVIQVHDIDYNCMAVVQGRTETVSATSNIVGKWVVYLEACLPAALVTGMRTIGPAGILGVSSLEFLEFL